MDAHNCAESQNWPTTGTVSNASPWHIANTAVGYPHSGIVSGPRATNIGHPKAPMQQHMTSGQMQIPTAPTARRSTGTSSLAQTSSSARFSTTGYPLNASATFGHYTSHNLHAHGQAFHPVAHRYNQQVPALQQPYAGYASSPYGAGQFSHGSRLMNNQAYLGGGGGGGLPQVYPPPYPTYTPPGLAFDTFNAGVAPLMHYGNAQAVPFQTPPAPKRRKRRTAKIYEWHHTSPTTSSKPDASKNHTTESTHTPIQAAPQNHAPPTTAQEQQPTTPSDTQERLSPSITPTKDPQTSPVDDIGPSPALPPSPRPTQHEQTTSRTSPATGHELPIDDDATAGGGGTNPWQFTLSALSVGLIVQIKPNACGWSNHPGIVLGWDGPRRIRVAQVTGFGADNKTVRERFAHIVSERQAEYLAKAFLLIAHRDRDGRATETHYGCPVLEIADGLFLPKRSYVSLRVVKTLRLAQLMLFTPEKRFVRRCLTPESVRVMLEYRESIEGLLRRQDWEDEVRRGREMLGKRGRYLGQQPQQHVVARAPWQGQQWQGQYRGPQQYQTG
ncbi:hypothetical protein SLS58_006300 [Diplodia intermedia]|uniref:Uncharacterized protein n=1 Tax=Diplodia intermedia TaxID=856260 RepID=A0ABR3TNU3_9PEZI